MALSSSSAATATDDANSSAVVAASPGSAPAALTSASTSSLPGMLERLVHQTSRLKALVESSSRHSEELLQKTNSLHGFHQRYAQTTPVTAQRPTIAPTTIAAAASVDEDLGADARRHAATNGSGSPASAAAPDATAEAAAAAATAAAAAANEQRLRELQAEVAALKGANADLMYTLDSLVARYRVQMHQARCECVLTSQNLRVELEKERTLSKAVGDQNTQLKEKMVEMLGMLRYAASEDDEEIQRRAYVTALETENQLLREAVYRSLPAAASAAAAAADDSRGAS